MFLYQIVNSAGVIIEKGSFNSVADTKAFDMSKYNTGLYMVRLTNDKNIVYRVKITKM